MGHHWQLTKNSVNNSAETQNVTTGHEREFEEKCSDITAVTFSNFWNIDFSPF
jgi:hypothetical protein